MSPAAHRSARALWLRNWAIVLPNVEPGTLAILQQATSAYETNYASPAAWALNVPAMASSNNYGAITCPGPESATCIGGVRDNTQAGQPYKTFFRAYATPDEGVQDVIRRLSRPAIAEGAARGNVTDYVRAMYASKYFAGVCSVANSRYGTLPNGQPAAASQSTFNTGKPATTAAGEACDEEVIAAYAAKIKAYSDQITEALGLEPIPLESVGDRVWPVLGVLGVLGAGLLAWWYFKDEPLELPELPIRRNAPRAAWRELYRTTCGEDRDQRRAKVRELGAARRAKVGEEVTEARGEMSKARRAEVAAARKREALAARIEAKRAKLKADLAELEASAEKPCDDAKRSLHVATEREKRERSERRTPKQRAASRAQLDRIAELIEREANDLENEIDHAYPGEDLGPTARLWFLKHARRFMREAKREGGRTRPAELAFDAFAEDVENQRAQAAEDAEKSDDEYAAEEAAYWEQLQEAG